MYIYTSEARSGIRRGVHVGADFLPLSTVDGDAKLTSSSKLGDTIFQCNSLVGAGMQSFFRPFLIIQLPLTTNSCETLTTNRPELLSRAHELRFAIYIPA